MRPSVFSSVMHGAFHVDFHAEVNAVILQGPDHLESGAVADVRQARISMSAEVTLQDATVFGPIEQRAPCLELADAIRSLLRVQFHHAPVVQILAAAHGVGEMHLPVVAVVDVGQGGRDSTLGHDRVRLAEQRLANYADAHACGGCFNRRPQTRSACADHQHVVIVCLVFRHQTILQSVQMPIAAQPDVEIGEPTQNRLSQAHSMWRRLRQLDAFDRCCCGPALARLRRARRRRDGAASGIRTYSHSTG